MSCKWFGRVIIALLIALLAGCNSVYFGGTPNLDENWGKSFDSARAGQTLNPEASDNLDPVEGLDGQAADKQVDQYRNNFGCKQAASTADTRGINVINLR